MLKYTENHEWIRSDGDGVATVGITEHAQDALGDVVFVELPQPGSTHPKGAVAGVVESVKAAADVYMPASGKIVEVNAALQQDPALANSSPLEAGWFFRIALSDPAELDALMDETRYGEFSKNG